MMATRQNLTDRAKRYRAQYNVTGPRKCVLCGSRSDIQVMHLSGNEDDGERSNLAYGCRSCNGKLSAAFKRIGAGRPTRQYNPAAGGIPTYEQYKWGVTHHNRGEHDEGGAVIHATPKHKRIQYAKMIARETAPSKRETFAQRRRDFEDRYNPATRDNLFGFGRPDARRTTPATGGIAYHLSKRSKQGRPSTAAAGSAGSHKGYKISRTADGEFFSSLDPQSLFETKRGATSLIDSYLKGRTNPTWDGRPITAAERERRYAEEDAERAAAEAHAEKVRAHQEKQLRKGRGNPARKVLAYSKSLSETASLKGPFRTVGGGVPVMVLRKSGKRLFVEADNYGEKMYGWVDPEDLEKPNPSKFDRCVKDVKAKGGAGNAYAVCTAAGTRNAAPEIGGRDFRGGYKLDQKLDALNAQMSRVSITSKKWRELNKRKTALLNRIAAEFRGNPADASAKVFEEFHGFEPREVVTVTKKIHHHSNLAAAGELKLLKIWGVDEQGHSIQKFKGALLAFNEDKNQLFVEGGDQRVNLDDFGITKPHELETLGVCTYIGYDTDKTHLGSEGGKALYVHKFRTTNDNGRHVVVKYTRYPDLIYDVRNEQLLFSGGSYEILAEGINQ